MVTCGFWPGGKTPPYLAHYLFKNVAIGSDKYTLEDNGFDGFGIMLQIIKARSNQSGQSVKIIFNKVAGVSPIRTNIEYAKDQGLVGGNKNSMYFINNKEDKFSLRDVEREFTSRPELYKIMYDHIIPVLSSKLSEVTSAQEIIDDALLEY